MSISCDLMRTFEAAPVLANLRSRKFLRSALVAGKKIERMADMDRSESFPGVVKLLLNLDQPRDKVGALDLGQTVGRFGHAICLSQHAASVPPGR